MSAFRAACACIEHTLSVVQLRLHVLGTRGQCCTQCIAGYVQAVCEGFACVRTARVRWQPGNAVASRAQVKPGPLTAGAGGPARPPAAPIHPAAGVGRNCV